MYFLEQKKFKPLITLLSVPFVLCVIILLIAGLIRFEIKIIFYILILLAIHMIITFFLWKSTRDESKYLDLKDDEIQIVSNYGLNEKYDIIKIPYDKIIHMEYYKIISLYSLLMLFTYTLPNCVYISHTNNKKSQVETIFIGYLNYKDVKEISSKYNIKLIVH